MSIETLAIDYINARVARRAAKAAYRDRRSAFLSACPIQGFTSGYDRLDHMNPRHRAAIAATDPEWQAYQEAVRVERLAHQRLERAVRRVSK